ncbi:MAG: hypothetical protein ACPG3X_06765 [Opitutales bacterium]
MLSKLTVEYLLFCLAAVSVLLPIVAGRMSLPILNLLGRWVRWFLFAALLAFTLHVFELSFRPAWVHFLTGLAIWFVIETGYNWIAIQALSRSELPLFPNFRENTDGDEWPADKRFIDLKDWLKAEGYKRSGALKAELFEGSFLRASVYESADRLTRIQILFLPKRQGGSTACYTIQTRGSDGRRLITDNQFIPYGGYYPEKWELARKPLTGSLKGLLALHRRRLSKSELSPVTVDGTALEELNEQQRVLERLNTDTGFLVPRPEQEEEGKITADGRYRLWKEMWLLAYLGISVS